MKIFKKILIANRGEIAVRIIKSANRLGIRTVAIYSEVDKNALFISMADESYCIGKLELSETYLNIYRIIEVAKTAGCCAIHPGYGFLAENPELVLACERAGITFIGPKSHALKLMGNKIESRNFIRKIGIPLVDATSGNNEKIIEESRNITFPLLVKAAAGGGGKGMRIVHNDKELEEAIESTSREAKSYFGDGTVYVEKYLEGSRHIEIQIIGDNFGNVVHLFERECSIQRRYQKIIEESPSPTLNEEVRKKMGEAAVSIGKAISYNSAGTIEFLVDKELNYYFLEMNTRIQVEHPITEMVTDTDIVKEQILVAAGNKLSLKQEELKQNGHAIECRIYAEDPLNNFLPSPGKMSLYIEPEGVGVRVDSGNEKETTIQSIFDPMISKLIVWAEDRMLAREKMINALKQYIIHGISTNIPFLFKLLQHDAYSLNKISTKFCDEHINDIISVINKEKETKAYYIPLLAFLLFDLNKGLIKEETKFKKDYNVWEKIGYWRDVMEINVYLEEKFYSVLIKKISKALCEFEICNEKFISTIKAISKGKIEFTINDFYYTAFVSVDTKGNAYVTQDGSVYLLNRKDVLINEDIFSSSAGEFKKDEKRIFSPMPGKVVKISVNEGDRVRSGDLLLVVEAMKMENNIASPKDAVIDTINVSTGDMVDGNKPLIILKDNKD